MALLAAILLAVFVLPRSWAVVAIAAAAAWELCEAFLWVRWSQRRRAHVGAEALLGATARAVSPLEPYGHVRINGELWRARAAPGPIRSDQDVVVRDLEGLTLVVEPGPLVIRSGDVRGAR